MKRYKAHHVYSLCVNMYVSFPLAGFDTSESATHLSPIYLRSCEKNNIGTNVTSENQLLLKLSLTIIINPYVDHLKLPLMKQTQYTKLESEAEFPMLVT